MSKAARVNSLPATLSTAALACSRCLTVSRKACACAPSGDGGAALPDCTCPPGGEGPPLPALPTSLSYLFCRSASCLLSWVDFVLSPQPLHDQHGVRGPGRTAAPPSDMCDVPPAGASECGSLGRGGICSSWSSLKLAATAVHPWGAKAWGP
eukprot:9412615-Pyramimonas_sp.AAC.1